MATKKELENKRELARLYYMQSETQKEIAQKVGVSEPTVGKWVNDGNWAIKRASVNITRAELVNKTLLAINAILEEFNNSDDPEKTIDADKLCKLAKIVENLDKKSNIVDVIETFMAFNKWLQHRMTFDTEISIELVKTINKYQDLFVSERISKKYH
ncbi:MAG: terminase [Prevotellaceae bacterium]|nr:terminase [Prevotellaceae bacterium]